MPAKVSTTFFLSRTPTTIDLFVKKTFFVLILLCLDPVTACARELPAYKSGPSQNTLIELYTSDANAACNPALTWFSSLRTDNPAIGDRLWRTVFPVAFHSSYWDAAGGYKDLFSKKPFDDLLLAYKNFWRTTRAYAPTFVVNGTEWSGWSRGQEIPSPPANPAGVLSAVVSDFKREEHFTVGYAPGPAIGTGDLVLHAVILGFGYHSRPTDGENRGAVLNHDFIALKYLEGAFRFSYGALTAEMDIPYRAFIRDKRPYAVVFWVTRSGDPRPLQATGGLLPRPS